MSYFTLSHSMYKFYGLIFSDMIFKQDKTNRISNLIKFEFNLGNIKQVFIGQLDTNTEI